MGRRPDFTWSQGGLHWSQCARDHQKEISLQPFSRKLREAMGQKLSTADFWREVSGVPLQTDTQIWAAQSAAIPHAHPADGENV
jgi:hypothetical protein